MEKAKVLFVTQEITPYLKGKPTWASSEGIFRRGYRKEGREIRTFMPRYGNINEQAQPASRSDPPYPE
ncbi:MAG: hypothetical protein MZV63_55510 [Marinilabiliales bacterium]|nr:hypothetical protein [Marinilabiliales bacterium]